MQENFTLTVNEDQTFAEVKVMIAEARGEEFPVELQKLIYNARLIDDATKVGELGFDPAKFIVAMTTKKKAEPPVAGAEGAGPAPPVVAPAAAAPAAAAPEALTPEQEESIAAIMEIGADREQAVAVLRAARWSRDRAAGYLFNGIPEDSVVQEPAPQEPRAEEQGGEAPAVDAEAEAQEHEDLDILANLPQLEEIRQLVQQNPENLAPILQQIAAHNPRLVRTIQNNQQEFMDMLNGAGQYDQNLPGAGAGAAGAAAGGQGGRRRVVHLNQEQLDAINRIKAIVNASEATVVEAYFACDQDEEAAINFIFNTMDEQ
ncbi:hypothetical protein CAEBREN_15682 [Caenorhabditis brenneri]|uniref:UV excision repair protein RAD23 n=1 Tax=Caenorhabditis brenneri TaxID=135651 RepID=G0NDA8_CAEBE|nr:hypothetical protein CAEBREN_15682 [Caenorhabditis brenneri]